jgi:hypothetical protein
MKNPPSHDFLDHLANDQWQKINNQRDGNPSKSSDSTRKEKNGEVSR